MIRRTAAIGAWLAVAAAAMAQPSSVNFQVSNSTVDSGGGSAASARFELLGSIGQSDASPQSASGSIYQVSGGLLAASDPGEAVFSDGFESSTVASGL